MQQLNSEEKFLALFSLPFFLSIWHLKSKNPSVLCLDGSLFGNINEWIEEAASWNISQRRVLQISEDVRWNRLHIWCNKYETRCVCNNNGGPAESEGSYPLTLILGQWICFSTHFWDVQEASLWWIVNTNNPFLFCILDFLNEISSI